jgi:presenilin-like A22 family membrane protease
MVELEAARVSNFLNYVPVLLTVCLTWFFSYIVLSLNVKLDRPFITPLEEPEPTAPPSEALVNPAPYLNTLIVILVITVAGVVLLYMARRMPRVFKSLITSLIWIVSFGISMLYLFLGMILINTYISETLFIYSAILASVITYFTVKGGELKSSIASSYIASGAGSILGVSIPYWTFLILIIGISIYDIIAVFKGHLSSISKSDAPLLRGLVVEIGDVALGLGDLFFYSLTISAILFNYSITPAITASTSIIIGYMIIIYTLNKRKQLPGLPIPLLLALATALIIYYML